MTNMPFDVPGWAIGDALDLARQLPDCSIDCIITSPPYWGLRSYLPDDHPDKAREMGAEPTLVEYVDRLVALFRELRRALKPAGTCFLNLGDSYFGSRMGPQGATGQRAGRFTQSGTTRRAQPCDTSGKALPGWLERDSSSFRLCGACGESLGLRTPRTDGQHAAEPSPSALASIQGHMESPPARPANWDSPLQESHRTASTLLPLPGQAHGAAQPPASRGTTQPGSSRPPQVSTHQSGIPSGGQTLPSTSSPGVPRSSHTQAESDGRRYCTAGTASPFAERMLHTQDIGGCCSRCGEAGSWGDSTTMSLKPKDLCLVPYRVALALQADGWWLRDNIVWHKPNPMPASVTDRCTSAHEAVFLLTKSAKYSFDSEAIKEQATGRASGNGFRRDHMISLGGRGRETQWEGAETRNRRNVWTIATKPYSGSHYAVMPPALVEPCVKAGCPAGGIVLDPFGGSGTVAEVAESLGRRWLLFDIDQRNVDLMKKRTAQRSLLGLF